MSKSIPNINNKLTKKTSKVECSTDPFLYRDSNLQPTTRMNHVNDSKFVKNFDYKHIQWSSCDGSSFLPTFTTTNSIPPGYYEVRDTQEGLYFHKINVNTAEIIELPESICKNIMKEIQTFWEREDIFKKFNLTFKRGIILYGPPGTGKSTIVQSVCQDVIDRQGIVINFKSPYTFSEGIRLFREIQPDTPVVVLMEDIDSLLMVNSETEIINILDGVNKQNKIIFLATTNYPENLGDRIMNRPSRFDKKFEVPNLSDESRKTFLEHMIKNSDIQIDINKWVADTKGFTVAHLKELFTAVNIIGDNYEEALQTLKNMKKRVVGSKESSLGFR